MRHCECCARDPECLEAQGNTPCEIFGLLGAPVSKRVGSLDILQGAVASFTPPGGTDPVDGEGLFNVVYDNGDTEDLTAAELENILVRE